MKQLLAAAVCATAMTGAASASTVTIDFVALAALANSNAAYGGSTSGDYGDAEGQTFSFGDLDVTLTSSANAYLDDVSGGLPAGLGVCSTGITGTGQCSDAGDDNVTSGEFVTLTFNGATVLGLSDFVFRGANHVDISNSSSVFDAIIDDEGGTSGIGGSFANAASNIASIQIGAISALTLAFSDISGSLAGEFYLSSVTVELAPVPLPASVLLLGGAVGGLGLMRRRRKAA